MITNVRSALIVDHVKRDDETGISLIGVHGDRLEMDYRPALMEVWLALVVDTDGKTTSGTVIVRAPDYSITKPIDVPAGHKSSSWNAQLAIPVVAEGVRTPAMLGLTQF